MNPANGAGTLSIPLPLSPGRSGFTPMLSLSYDSGAGNGPFGLILPKPVTAEITTFDWLDGFTVGFALCVTCGRTYHFELIADDYRDAGERVYAFKAVTRESCDAVVAVVETAATTPAEIQQRSAATRTRRQRMPAR